MTVRLTFHGAARTVTGSCYLLEHAGGRFLVDCGLFQGTKTVRRLNYQGFPFDPHAIDFVVLTHAHIDHSGLMPKLVKHGFSGPVFVTAGTRDLLTWMLPDSGYIQETEVQRLNRRNAARGLAEVEPIYTKAEAEEALKSLESLPLDRWLDLPGGVRGRLWHAGHILGAASLELEIPSGRESEPPLTILFSGDIGPGEKAFYDQPKSPTNLDFLVVEGTYGGRNRSDRDPTARRAILQKEVSDALKQGGNLLIPAFAVERTQELLYDLGVLFERGDLPRAQVFLDSPLAIRATEVFEAHMDDLEDIGDTRHRFRNPNFRFVLDPEESRALANITSGAIIIAASGMCDAGRIRHHLAANLWRPQATVLLVGYQAPGTLGHLLQSGVSSVRIHGAEVAVKARIRTLDVYSAHADQDELMEWIGDRLPIRRAIFLTHGEPGGLASLRELLLAHGQAAERVNVPALDECWRLTHRGALRHELVNPRLEPTTADAAGETDWHNRYAALMLEISETVRQARDDRRREQLLEGLRETLDGWEAMRRHDNGDNGGNGRRKGKGAKRRR